MSVGLALLLPRASSAAPFPERDIPNELKPWVPWVLDSLGDRACPSVGEARVCVWPGLLRLELDEQGGIFFLTVTADQTAQVQLPGSAKTWPQDVHVGGTKANIVDDEGVPRVTVERGTHRIDGRFRWRALPESLVVTQETALISLRVLREEVPFPKRDPGLLWLRGQAQPSSEPESTSIEVFRHLTDDVPFKVTTRLVLHVSGKARELKLDAPLLAGSQATAILSDLPARLENNSQLAVQVYAGTHTITLEALYATPPTLLAPPPNAAPWPDFEVWVFAPNNPLRQVEIGGGTAVDPQRTHLPSEWKSLSAYRVGPKAPLELRTARRGEPDPAANDLRLTRELWLDLDGQGFTVSDQIEGRMNRGWRLDLKPAPLGHVTLGGNDQLITHNPSSEPPHTGVEVRDNQVSLRAEWRLPGTRTIPAVGWSENMQQLETQVHVPPGWQLLSASGVDDVSNEWLSNWDLFSLFFVLMLSLAVSKLTQPLWGALTLVTLVLTQDQAEAPRWLWMCLITAIALLRILPSAWPRKLVVGGTFGIAAWLVIVVVGFSVQQARTALYPQAVEEYTSGGTWDTPTFAKADVAAAESAPAEQQEGGSGVRAAGEELKRYAVSGKSLSPAEPAAPAVALVQQIQDPQAIIQTGPGVPTWKWETWHLRWSGPVHQDHLIHLYLISPTVNGLFCVLRLLLCGALALLLLKFAFDLAFRPPQGPRSTPGPRVAAATLHLLRLSVFGVGFLLTSLTPKTASAELPSDARLTELRDKLTREAPCSPHCLSVQNLLLQLEGGELRLTAEVSAEATAAYQLPGPLQNWLPNDIRIGGQPALGLARLEDGFLHLRLTPGSHRIEMRGPVAYNNLTLQLGSRPRLVTAEVSGWSVDGLSEDGQVDGALQLSRQLTEAAPSASQDGRTLLPSWIRITRTFQFGVTWNAHTRVERLGPTGSAVLLRYPLLPGERATRAEVLLEGGIAVIQLDRDAAEMSFESVLGHMPETDGGALVELVAGSPTSNGAATPPYSERWLIQCGPIWQCRPSGLDPVSHQQDARLEPSYLPWPGEKLSISLKRPTAAGGASLTVDSARLSLEPGVRLLGATLAVALRASAQTTLAIELPASAEVQKLEVNGSERPFRRDQNGLELNLEPGAGTVSISWQQAGGMSALFRGPNVKLNHQLVNAEVSVSLPSERWLLYARGPAWGPAILFWGYLLLILILTPVLGRLPESPLRAWQWLLLALGLTQIPVVVSAVIVAWFFAFALIPRWRPASRGLHNLSQVGLAF
ncbi:MAG: hypothetical protein RJA70_2034, partial [Pseudomonadota bacterium]